VPKRRADVEVDSPSQAELESAFERPSAVRTSPITGHVNVSDLESAIDRILQDRLGHFISDIERRLTMAYEVETSGGGRRIAHARDLNVNRHFIEGYTVTANSPGAGSIAWTNVHIVYNGVDYTCADGNTALKYVWFVKPGSGTTATLQTSNTQPVLATGDTLVFVNTAGVPTSVLEGGGGIAAAVGPSIQIATTQITGSLPTTQISGILPLAQVPTIPTTQISGTLPLGQIPTIPTTQISGTLPLGQIPTIPTTQISGSLPTTQISGVLPLAQVPTIPTSQISGVLPLAQVPTIPTTQISGTVPLGQIPTIPTTQISGVLPIAQVPAIPASKLNILQHVLY
jgi:hypothetical protein